jgi:hypothetical protein
VVPVRPAVVPGRTPAGSGDAIPAWHDATTAPPGAGDRDPPPRFRASPPGLVHRTSEARSMSGTRFLPALAQTPPAGLLNPMVIDLASLAPPPPYRMPREMMVAGQLSLSDRGQMAAAMPDLYGEDVLPEPLRPYRAGLQPFTAPAGVAWQQQVIFDRLAVTDDDVQAEMMSYYQQARMYDNALSYDRIKASDYYRGKPLGDEEAGRSQLVLTTVRDTVRATLPSLLRVFTAVENPVEFTPTVSDNEQLGELHAELARQATSYARWALFTANRGWLVLHDAILNALTRKVGWIRWRWGERRAQRVEDCDGLLAPQLRALLAEPGIIAQRVVKRPMLPSEQRAVAATPEGMAYFQAGGPPVLFGARITRTAARSWPIVESVEPECVWIVADADQAQTARAVFHVRDLPASDLIAAGLPREAVERAAQEETTSPRMRREREARDPVSGRAYRRGQPGSDRAMKLVRYTEGWCQMDTDGDGVAELIHTHALGTSPKLCRWDRTDEVPLAAMTPYREPGRVIGYSQADMVLDLQRTQTRVMRATLDALGQSIYPRTVVQVGAANIEDTRQTAIGAIIRVTQQGAVTELGKPYIGDKALMVMQQLDAIKEGRTGITRTSQGLTAESLQSTTPLAVDAQTGAAMDRLDMIARTLAETGLAPLYLGLLRLMAKHQDRPNVLSIRGKWIAVDPRALSVMWDVQCNVGGKGTPAERLAMLNAIATKQEQILAPAVQQGMLDTPIVGLPQYRNTLARMCETAGISDVVSYFKELPPAWQPPPPPPPKPSTDEVLAEVEAQKMQAKAVDDARQSETDRIKLAIEDDRSRAEAAVTAWVQSYSTAAVNGTPLPSIDEFKAALRSTVPIAALFAQPAPPSAAIPNPGGTALPPPALGVPAMAGGRGGAAVRPPGVNPGGGAMPVPAGGPLPPGPARPDAASLMAMRRALLARDGPNAGAALIDRAVLPPGGPQPGQ